MVKNVSVDYYVVGFFIDVVIIVYVIVVVLKVFGMLNIDDFCLKILKFIDLVDKDFKKRFLDKIVREMVDIFFLNSLVVVVNRIEVDDNNIEGLIINDGVYDCVINVIKYGFLKKNFILVIRSGDGIC